MEIKIIQKINSIMKINFRHIAYILLTLLLLGGVANEAWAAQITYHILTLPCKHTATVPDATGWVGNTRVELDGYRQEAIKVIVSGTNVELPAYLKSPLAKNFTYYQSAFVAKKSNNTEKVYENNNNTKAFFYSAPIAPYTKVTKSGGAVTEEIASTSEAWSGADSGHQKTATDLANYNSQKTALADGTYYFKMNCLQESDAVTSNCDIYVTYEYNPDNTIAKLDGSVKYNIKMGDYGFLALNRGRNNRPAVIPEAVITDYPEYLTSDEFVTIPHNPNQQIIPGTNNVQGYWKDDPYNSRDEVAYQFHFLFKYYGLDPYNITISSAYDTDKYYVEKYGNGSIVKKWYKGSSFFVQSGSDFFVQSDDNKLYTQTSYTDPTTPVTSEEKYGYYKGLNTIWNSFALLYACDKDGNIKEGNLVLMGSRTVKGDGSLDYTNNKQFYFARTAANNNNNWKFSSLEKQSAPTLDKKMYEIKDVNFKVKTPFGNIVTASIKLSEYTLGIKDIAIGDIPDELKRKYCSFNNKFYKDAALTEQITSYSELTGGTYDIYVGYTVDMPFKTVSADAGADAYKTATWYELTDEGSTEANGKKIIFDSPNFKNNGASGTFNKTTEFAFAGDPYELRVLYRDATETNEANRYVGGSTNLDVSTTAGEDYRWEIPNDNTNGSFLLRKLNGTGHWYWPTDHLSQSFTYETKAHDYSVDNGNAQTLTFTITNLTYVNGHYIKVTKGGSNPGQVVSTIPTLDSGKGAVQSDGTATVTVNIAANSGSSKTFTLTIQEYNGSTNAAIGDPTVITVTQAASAYAGNLITYSTTNSTRIKLLDLPKRTYTYVVVDKSGRKAVKASIDQPIYSSLLTTVSQRLESSLPSDIVSPYLVGETLTYYSAYSGGGRGYLLPGNIITQTPASNATIFVTYTTTNLDAKPNKLSEDQEFYVNLNGQYLYFDATNNCIKSSAASENTNNYKWKLRNRDPYDMLIDNVGAREDTDFNVAGQFEEVTVYNDSGEGSSVSRQKGVWVISEIPVSITAGSTTSVNLSKDAIASVSIGVTGLTEGSSLSVNASDGNLSSITVTPTTVTATGTATITATLAANNTESSVRSTITLTESGSGSSTTKIVLIQDEEGLGFTTSRISAQHFIAKSGRQGGVYEVMVATGDGIDAGGETPTYYNIGRAADNTVKIYNNSTYAHGNKVLEFRLEQTIEYVYHLIDIAKHELLTVGSKNPDLVLPSDYQSPLVGHENYSYYARDQINIDGKGTSTTSDDEYTPINAESKLSSTTDLDAQFTTDDSDATEYANHGSSLTAVDLTDMQRQAKLLTVTGDYYYKIGESTYKRVNVTRGNRGSNIYVTYVKNNLVTFNDDASPYMLKFLDPYADGYFLEDGNDKLTKTRIQAVYPYCNGDGSLNIYGNDMQKEQFDGGASTRPRWIWFFESESNDPYHVKIHSKSTISYSGITHPTYLQTYAVHFNQDASADTKHIVTCGNLAGIASVEPTEYMILGSEGQYKLLTTYPIEETVVDGSADKDRRQYVKSFEQYWKTYNMIKQCVLKIDTKTGTYKDEFSNDESTWVVPTELRETLKTKLDELLIGGNNWHSYDVVANALRWNGFNDKEKANTKLVEKLEHWFQTFDMGDGTFDIESADIPPVLVLLDRHGWEIMRKPLGYNSSTALDVLKSYDSPMVKEYKFYSNATKASGCHKYTLRMQNGAERDQIKKANGEHYTSTSLGDLPPETAKGVKDNTDAFNDQFVTYTVKEEYEKSYQYHLELHEEDQTFEEWGTPSKFLVLQHNRFARNNADGSKPAYLSKPIYQGSGVAGENGEVYDMILAPTDTYADPSHTGVINDVNLWYVGPNLNIDEEMGIKWAQTTGNSNEPVTEYETKKAYKDKTGFDPYNIQLQLVEGGKYLTTDIKTTKLDNGSMVGDYTGGSNEVTLQDVFTSYDPSDDKGSEGYDHTKIQMSNQTFMAVSDANGNMQLMPRFDHTKRISVSKDAPYLTTLENPVDHAEASVDDWRSMGPQTTFFVRPQIFEYHIIDNEGNESLRYKRAGDYVPNITEHFISPLARDFEYYFGYAAGSTSASSKTSYDLATPGGSTAFQKTATSEANMTTQAKHLVVLDDYYFKVTSDSYKYVKVTVTTPKAESDAVYTLIECTETDWTNHTGGAKVEDPVADDAALETAAKALESTGDFYYRINTYNYKKVTVTKAYSAEKEVDATYTTASCTETDWTNAVAYQQTSTDDAHFISDAKALDNKGLHYFQIGPTTLYRKVTVDGTKKTAEESNSSDWESHSDGTQVTVADMTAYKSAVDALSSDGTVYYKITSYYSYKKVVVTNTNGSFSTEVSTHADISSREITGTFAEAGLNDMTNQVYVRYSYNPGSDVDGLLQGKWLTIKLANVDVQSYGKIENHDPIDGTGVSLYTGTKPEIIDGATDDSRKWQWKFLASPVESSSDYYGTLDPYAVRIFNRYANYAIDVSLDPNPMGTGIKVNGTDRFALLSTSVGYAFAVAGENDTYTYSFLNGTGMTAPDAVSPVAATTAPEPGFTIKTGTISDGSIVVVNDDVTYRYDYKVITNDDTGNKLAVSATQDKAGASEHGYVPYLPFDIQSKLLDIDKDYEYYGSATESGGAYTVNDATKLVTLYGLYNDEVYVRYKAYSMDNTKYEVPNKKDVDGSGNVIKHAESKDAALNIDNGLPYNIIWEKDNMMRSNDDSNTDTDGTYIKGKAGQNLQADGDNGYVWKFQSNDPYALKIYNGKQGKYIHAASAADGAACTLTETPTEFMLLKRENYENGVFEMTGHKGYKLTMTNDNGSTLGIAQITTGDPHYFIIFGLSTHRLIYHLVIAKTCPDHNNPQEGEYVDIPHRTTESGELKDLRIYGTTQRDLTNKDYQLGSTILGQTYSVDAGEVSIGDVLKVPKEFDRPNCVYFYYVDNIQTSGDPETTYQVEATDDSNYASKKADTSTYTVDGYYYFKIGTGTYTYKRVQVKDKVASDDVDCTADDYNNAWQDNATLNGLYKGMEVTKLMSEPGLIGGLVKINVAYAFQTGLETNAGEGFVTDLSQNLWYTFETKNNDGTPYLAHYTNAWGLQAMPGLDTRYTNDYLWCPLGDVYGFKMYNRYMIKNSSGVANVMITDDISEGQNLKMAVPTVSTSGNEVYELLGSNNTGYFKIHPVINNEGTQYYVWKDPADNYAKLSTSYSEWTFNLPLDLLKPYIERVGYVGGLTKDAYDDNKTVLDKVMNGTATYADLLEVQGIVYNDDNIVKYKRGYYRLHSQPGVSGITPVRYASGYLHKIELTGDGTYTSGPIPLHFYSKKGVSTTFGSSGLKNGYTETKATHGDIPVDPTEYDPSTVFYFDGEKLTEEQIAAGNVPTSKMQTQGLYVAADANGDDDSGTTTNRLQRAVMVAPNNDNSLPSNVITFSLMDIGGAVLLIHDGATPEQRRYLNFDQSNFFQRTATDDTDMTTQAAKFTSKGTYYFKIGESSYTYKKIEVTKGYVAGPPAEDAVCKGAESSTPDEWNKAADIYDLKYYHDSPTDDAKWCMVPADSLMVTTNNGGDDYYYSTFCAPFDVLLPVNDGTKTYYAYTCDKWDEKNLHPKKVDAVTGTPSYSAGKFVPAGTPVIIRTTDNSESMKLTFPSASPAETPLSCVFTGEYLEQLLDNGGGNEVYTLGLPFTSDVHKDPSYTSNGNIEASVPEQANSGVGFYINANPNKEHNALQSLWLRNNRYVIHNKIYYRAEEASGSPAPQRRGPEFVPVIFDDEEGSEELTPNGAREIVGDGCVYDLMGRKVATREQVEDGSWKQRVATGIYIINGKKIRR